MTIPTLTNVSPQGVHDGLVAAIEQHLDDGAMSIGAVAPAGLITTTGLLVGATLPAAKNGLAHFHTGNAGNVAAWTDADEVVAESAGNAGYSVLTGDAATGWYIAGSASDNKGAGWGWNHDANLMQIGTFNADGELAVLIADGVEALRFDKVGRLILGHNIPVDIGLDQHYVEIIGTDFERASLSMQLYSTTLTVGAELAFGRSRAAAPGSFALLSDGDEVGRLGFYADDSVDMTAQVGVISIEVDDATPATNAIGGAMVFKTSLASQQFAQESFRADNRGNFILSRSGGSLTPGNGQSCLVITNGTAPDAQPTDSVVLYAEDVASSSELKVVDEAGNPTTLSPHNFSLLGKPSEPMAWSFYSESKRHDKAINVDMLRAIRLVEKLSGEKLVLIEPRPH